jgi:hypothetical protein
VKERSEREIARKREENDIGTDLERDKTRTREKKKEGES